MSEKRDNNDSTVNNGKPAAWKLDKPADHWNREKPKKWNVNKIYSHHPWALR